ncbi:MAG: hypothetical protein M3O50_11925, partial [Myxococcota bacterium]|nr:hypothetical protein [Myxococcota bacterium]
MIARRALLRAAAFLGAASLRARIAHAGGRTPYGGRVRLHVPWPLSSVDPHRIDDPAAALFGDALFDSLYARDEAGAFIPSLAGGDPQPDGKTLRVPLRPSVRFASGSPLDGRTVAASIARARTHGAAAWLAEIPAPQIDQGDLVFASRDARKLVRALASPLVAVVPPHFLPERPDGTGPLRADLQRGVLVLSRNTLAANGPAFLDAIEARYAPDLSTSLRAFESRADDVGWLGSFLHEPRPGARSFDGGVVAWAVLRTGRDAGSLHIQGVAQALADGIPHASLASLVVGAPWATGSG